MRIWDSRAVRWAGAFIACGVLMMMTTAPCCGRERSGAGSGRYRDR